MFVHHDNRVVVAHLHDVVIKDTLGHIKQIYGDGGQDVTKEVIRNNEEVLTIFWEKVTRRNFIF